VDWSLIDRTKYLQAMERSPVNELEIKVLLEGALTEKMNDRQIYMKGIEQSYYYEAE
jgi:cell filamentation protein